MLMMYKREEAYRYTFSERLPCLFSIVGLEHKRIKTGKGDGELIDISPHGCRMSSMLNIPVEQEVVIQMEFTLHEDVIVVDGKIVWQRLQGDGFHYGVEFVNDESLEDLITDELKKFVKDT
jgi:PilZ domain